MAPRRQEAALVVILFVAYGSFYLCRANVDAALPLIGSSFGFDKERLGSIASIGVLGYAAGKFVLGPVGDLIGGRAMLLLAMTGSVAATLAFGTCSTLWGFAALAATNRFFQAAGWPGLVQVSSERFPAERHGRVMAVLSTSYELGNVTSLLLCGALIGGGLAWKWLFIVNPLLFGLIGVAASRALGQRGIGMRPPREISERADVRATFRALAGQPAFWATCVMSMLLTFVRTGLLTWMPTFLSELAVRQNATVSGAIVKSAVLPAAGIVGALAVGRWSDRFGPGKRAPVLAVSLTLLAATLFVLSRRGTADVRIALSAIAAAGVFLLGAYSLVAGAIALDIASDCGPATAAAWIDAAGYIGASLSGVTLGTLAQRRGWSASFDLLSGVVAVAALLAVGWSVTTLLPAYTARKRLG